MLFFANFRTSREYADANIHLLNIVFVPLFVAIVFLSIVRIVSYMRWTGKYPFYFLFPRPRDPDSKSTSNTLEERAESIEATLVFSSSL
jgi:hypothetical protein